MIACLICLQELEFSSDPSVCIPLCGHVFHDKCILKWCNELDKQRKCKVCPKCRCEIENTSSFIKIFFESVLDNSTKEAQKEIDSLLASNDVCKRRIEIMLMEMKETIRTIESNSKEIASKKKTILENEADSYSGPIQLKDLTVVLSREDEIRRMNDYYNSHRQSHRIFNESDYGMNYHSQYHN
ncbi:CLUMA_CG015218, isoform A [Clunio marinus]|uniref:CLUMA_CG015218, isoform A n=1 Tax=Clunio marinus TaxID=568069 RepID=A0A1J1IQM7_9DIPT|nr:CLUMA_CG015218, isoform A [Clunio marinus]